MPDEATIAMIEDNLRRAGGLIQEAVVMAFPDSSPAKRAAFSIAWAVRAVDYKADGLSQAGGKHV